MALLDSSLSRKLASAAAVSLFMFGAACSDDDPPPTAAPAIDVQLSESVVTLVHNQTNTVQVTATVEGTANDAVTWTSANEAVATVSQTGLITAVAEGNTFVTAVSQADPTKNRSVVVQVVGTVVTVTPATATTIVGGASIQLEATVENNPNTNVTWSSSNAAIATVDQNGVVTPVSGGTVTIFATSVAEPSKQGQATITVDPAILMASGVALTGLSASTDSETVYYIPVPAGMSSLTVTLTGGTGDADIYIWRNAIAGGTVCESWNDGNNETCVIENPAAGPYYILVHAWTAYSGVTLTATITP